MCQKHDWCNSNGRYCEAAVRRALPETAAVEATTFAVTWLLPRSFAPTMAVLPTAPRHVTRLQTVFGMFLRLPPHEVQVPVRLHGGHAIETGGHRSIATSQS